MKKAFTLSEVLITLGIVGVIAALTIPSIVANYKKRIYVAQLKRTYEQIYEATQAIMNDEHSSSYYATSAGVTTGGAGDKTTGDDCTIGPCYLLMNYFNTSKKNCVADDENDDTNNNECYAKSYKYLDGADAGVSLGGTCIQTTNGATICMTHNPGNQVTSVVVDVNGLSDPNMAGRDVFAMDIKADGSLSDYQSGTNDVSSNGALPENCGKGTNAEWMFSASAGCLNKVIEAGWKMDY